jgi:hypothetical protein
LLSQLARVRETESCPDEIVKVSPAVYALPVIDPENKKFPDVVASHAVKKVAVCDPAMFVQVTSASEVRTPADDAPNDAALRVTSVAGFAVPFDEGSPTWSLMYTVATAKEVLLPTASSHEPARYELNPVAIIDQPFPQ